MAVRTTSNRILQNVDLDCTGGHGTDGDSACGIFESSTYRASVRVCHRLLRFCFWASSSDDSNVGLKESSFTTFGLDSGHHLQTSASFDQLSF